MSPEGREGREESMTEEPEHNERLRAQCQELYDLIEAGVLIVRADGSGRIVFANGRAASLYGCEDERDLMRLCSSSFRGLMEGEDYRALLESSGSHPERFAFSYCYQTKQGHFRKAEGVGSLKDTPFGSAYVILLFSAEQLSSDLRGQDKTGVLGMHDFYKEALEQAERRRGLPAVRALCPVSFNLTDFKEYNRLYGLHRGDACLEKVAETITSGFPGALVGHLAADRFVALLPSQELEERLEKVCREVNRYIDDDGIHLKAGIYSPSEGDSLDVLRHGFDAAKLACDSIKADGNRIVAVYEPSMGKTEASKTYVLRHFSEALEKHYIKVYYQPIVRTLTGRLSGFEALVRWEDPALGMILPNVFVPVLEEAQLINRLDRYVLEQVARLDRDRMDNGLPLVPVSVNLSACDFDVANPIDTIEGVVRRYRIPRAVLCLEVTERVMTRNHPGMAKTVHQFRQAGYQVWMDDFGSEYSSLSLLHNYHFDVIKIDMGFFSHFDDRSRQIITSVVTMARTLGVRTLAEGVETKEQVSFLKKIGCGQIQGYFYGRPMMYEDTLSYMHDKGLQLENPKEAHLMSSVECVNVNSESPTAIYSFDGANIALLQENDAYLRELRSTGTQDMAEANANLGDARYPLRGRFRQLLTDALQSRSKETLTYSDNGQYMRVSVRWIAGDESGWVGEAHLFNISNDLAVRQAQRLDDTLRDIFQLYEGLYLIDRGSGKVEVLRSNHPELYGLDAPREVEAFLKAFAERLVYPDDRGRFLAFASSESVEAKARAEEGAALAEIVRIRRPGGTYRWTVLEALMIYKSATSNILLSEREDIWERKADRDKLLPVFSRSLGISEPGTEQPGASAEVSLFRMLCSDSPYPFFWKDRQGRILGASESLLKEHGVHDATELLGMTEDETGCNFDLTEASRSEESIQNEGKPVARAEELVLSGGRLRELCVTRVPWYQEKEIAGTLCMFDRVGSGDDDEESRLGLVDAETGFLSFRGAIEAGLAYADQYRLRKLDYVGLLIDVPAFAELAHTNEATAKGVLGEISSSLRRALGPGWAIARIGLCCFLCFSRRGRGYGIEPSLSSVSAALPRLWSRAGLQAAPELMHAVAYGSEVMTLDEMLQLMIRRLSSVEQETYGEKPYTEDRIFVRREVLDNLKERVIISDPETYELVYLNAAARKDVGIAPDACLKGRLCYKVLEGFDAPCRDCPNMMLRMDRALSLAHMNHKTGQSLQVRSFLTTWDKRTLKLTFAFNLDEYIETLAKDNGLVYQEMRAYEAISRGMQEADPEKGIERTISSIADNMHPERLLIFEERNDDTVSATYEWTAPGVYPLKEELQSIPRTELRALYARFVSDRLVMVSDMDAFLRENPGFSFRIHGVRSFVSGQLLLQNQREGFTLVVNPSEESFQTGSVLYSTLTDFIAVMVRNRNAIGELERRSLVDQLTGAGNRRALEQRVQAWQGDGVLGVVSVDLNGLKRTNDTEGHHAGDVLISETARILAECAGEDCVFRTGGDEFVVITEDLEERDILLLIQHMRMSAENNGISMAIGYSYARGKVTDFDALLTRADFNMYLDKGHSFHRRRSDRR